MQIYWNFSLACKQQQLYGPVNYQGFRETGLQPERSFSVMQDFRQSSEAISLSQVSKILPQLTGNISAHYSSWPLGPHTVQEMQETYLHLWRRAYIVVSFLQRNNWKSSMKVLTCKRRIDILLHEIYEILVSPPNSWMAPYWAILSPAFKE